MAKSNCISNRKKSPKLIDITGKTFGRLKVFEYVGDSYWQCICVCGKTSKVKGHCLRSGYTKSCGCLSAELASERNRTHGHTANQKNTREYSAWCGMIRRCYDPANIRYARYGGRGINVCQEWRDSFESFYLFVGPCPSSEHSIDRINNDENYEPGNVKWSTPKEQASNRRTTKLIFFDGKTQTISQWSRDLNVSHSLISRRIKSGWCVDCTITLPALLKGASRLSSICVHRTTGTT